MLAITDLQRKSGVDLEMQNPDKRVVGLNPMLKKLYDRSELWFAIAWIVAYVVLASAGDNLSQALGIPKLVTLPILAVLSAGLFFFVRKHGLTRKYGLCKPQIASAKMLYYAPLILLLTANLWYGVGLNQPPLETVLYVLSMFCVGFLEELIFRGLLFQAMAKDGVRSAIVVTSVTFGIGHIVNLFNGSGAELLPNLLQVMYAVAVGFAFVMIFAGRRAWCHASSPTVFSMGSVHLPMKPPRQCSGR